MFHRLGSGGKASSRWAIFCNALEKNCYSKAIWITFCTFVDPCKITKFLKLESQLKTLNCSIFHLLAVQVQNTFKILHFLVKFCKWLGPGRVKQDAMPPAIFLAASK